MGQVLLNGGGGLIFADPGPPLGVGIGPTTTTTTGSTVCSTVNCSGNPSMVLTVFDADYEGGDISWCGETWTQAQVRAGIQKCVCPASYFKGQATSTGFVKYFRASERWNVAGMYLRRGYQIYSYNGYFGAQPYWSNQIALTIATGAAYGTTRHRGYFWAPGGTSRPLYANTPGYAYPWNSTYADPQMVSWLFGWAIFNPATHNPGGYNITNNYFFSYVKSGVTYTWARGTGW